MSYDRDEDSSDTRFRGQSLANARSVKVHAVGGEPSSYVERLERDGRNQRDELSNGRNLCEEHVFKKPWTHKNRMNLTPIREAKPFLPSYQRQVAQLNQGAPNKNQLWQLEAKRRMAASADPERIARRAQTAGHSMQGQAVPVIRASDLLPVKRPKPKVVHIFKNASELKNGPDNIPNPGVCKYVGS